MEENKEEQNTNRDIIQTFYKDIQDLIVNATLYENACLELDFSFGSDMKDVPDNQKQRFMEIVQQVRFFIKKAYITYKSFEEDDVKKKSDIETTYDKLQTKFIPSNDDLNEYVISLNKYYIKVFLPNFQNNTKNNFKKILKT